MDRAARRQGRLNNTAAASAAGTLGDPSQDRDLPYHPTSNFLARNAADPVGQRDRQNAAWVAQAQQEADDPFDYSQPTPHMCSVGRMKSAVLAQARWRFLPCWIKIHTRYLSRT